MAKREDQEKMLTTTFARPLPSGGPAALPFRRAYCAIAMAIALVFGLTSGADRADAKSEIFSFSSQPSTTQAGGHPDIVTQFAVGTRVNQQPPPPCACNDPKDILLHAPPGVVANPHVASICTAAEAATYSCSADSQVGYIVIQLGSYAVMPIYRTTPQAGQAGLFVFIAPIGASIPQYIAFNARTESDYGLEVESIGITHLVPIESYTTVLWGVPGAEIHDPVRFDPGEKLLSCPQYPVESLQEGDFPPKCELSVETELGFPAHEKGSVSTSIPVRPMIQNPTACAGPLESSLETLAYDRERDFAQAVWPATTGCDQLSFSPSLSANPTTTATDTASGLEAELVVPQTQDPSTPSPSEIRAATMTLPHGFSINPNAADGKTACSDSQAMLGTREPARCPEFSKVGTVKLDSAALPAPITGYIYLAEPRPGNRYRILLTAQGFGTAVKIPGSVHASPTSGQLVVSFEDLPQAPFQEFDLHLFGSERGLLATPTACGTYPVHAKFVPWADVISTQTSTQFFVLDSGPNGEPCPDQPRPFAPVMAAGSEDNTAGRHSPLSLSLSRKDGEQNYSALGANLPHGLIATLKGIPRCLDSAFAQISQPAYPGLFEMASSACPVASQVGTVVASAGAGTKPVYVPGKVYLAGPYNGAPLSLIVSVPAVSGPYDLGTVATRVAIKVDPVTAQVTAESDPLPQILEGVPLRLRSIRLDFNRPNFILNPTNCDPFAIGLQASGDEGAVANPSSHFQVANCADLPYEPALRLRLTGGVNRRGHPAIHAVFRVKPGESNTRRVSVLLPKNELLDQAHIDTVCTRSDFARNTCPRGAAIGSAEVRTPILDDPLRGTVYLRSSQNDLPDLALDLEGEVDIEAAARVDSVRGGLRTTFEAVPDVPVSSIALSLVGGKKGLLENSESLCGKRKKYATVTTVGQNDSRHRRRVPLNASCQKASKDRKAGRRGTRGLEEVR